MTARLERAIPRERTCGAVARRWVEDQVGDVLSARALRDLKLVATELVNNAYLHGHGAIRLVINSTPGGMRVEVVDEGEGAAIQIRRRGLQAGGQGLHLVDALSRSWGVYAGTTHVWAEIPND